MSIGFQQFNNDGAILIDGESQNYSLLVEGTVSAGTAVNFSCVGLPLVFVRFNTTGATKQYVGISTLTSSQVVFQIWDSPANANNSAQVGGNVEYRIYGLASSQAPSAGYGMLVYSSTGALVFDSNRKYPKVREVATVSSIPPFADFNKHPVGAANHSQGANPWMLANFTINVYGYVYIQEFVQPTSSLMRTSIRSDTDNGNRILVQANKYSTIGTQGTQWSYASIPIPLIA